MATLNYKNFTLGVEEEYMVIDPVTLELKSHEQKIVQAGITFGFGGFVNAAVACAFSHSGRARSTVPRNCNRLPSICARFT
mgnify:CR=1 FL=1